MFWGLVQQQFFLLFPRSFPARCGALWDYKLPGLTICTEVHVCNKVPPWLWEKKSSPRTGELLKIGPEVEHKDKSEGKRELLLL